MDLSICTCIWICFCICIYICIYIYISIPIPISLSLSLALPFSVYRCVTISDYLSIFLPTYLAICTHICLDLSISFYLIHFSIDLSICYSLHGDIPLVPFWSSAVCKKPAGVVEVPQFMIRRMRPSYACLSCEKLLNPAGRMFKPWHLNPIYVWGSKA